MRKVLIIEDDALTAKLYRDFLQQSGFEVQVARDGAAGLAHLATDSPDAMLVDLMMPNMNGIEFLKTVRAMEPFQNIPVFVYTTAFIPQMIQEAKDAGATDIFDKAQLTGPLLRASLRQYLGAAPG